MDPINMDSVSRDSVSRDSVSRDSVSRDSVSRDSVSRDPMSRDPVSSDPVDPNSGEVDFMNINSIDMNSADARSAVGAVSRGTSDVEVVLHAQRLLISRQRVATERVRFVKQIVTSTRTIEVPVRIEQLVISHEPLTGAADDGLRDETGNGRAGTELSVAGADASGLVIVLHEEVPEVTMRVVAKERVSVGVRTVNGEQVVSASLGTEVVDVDTDAHVAGSIGGPVDGPIEDH
ncbi:YsnF/AvaK domain-containing protein [Kineococcus sp. NBC_00420]|uniref:YsnF/AvaK domain-containing protein n=1 Tax=Kineococcus sp. NBC_00420 TaxID=2903564 RepID=UPI002E206941